MGTNNNTVVVSFSIAILLLLSLLLLLTYNSKCNVYNLEPMQDMQSSGPSGLSGPSVASDPKNKKAVGQLYADITGQRGAITGSSAQGASTFTTVQNPNAPTSAQVPTPTSTTPSTTTEMFENAPYPSGMEGAPLQGSTPSQNAQACFPRDRLTADDLLPKDAADSKWARLNPSGTGDIHDQNYLTAGYHIGVNTVGQSMRNANLQLRSEIPNPQNPVGPWMISTIEPDLRPNTLEIGSSPAY